MNKVIIKESGKKHVSVEIVLYILYGVIGFVLLNLSEIGMKNPVSFIPTILYIFDFLSLFCYFINRREDDYELLLLGVINVLVGTFIMYYTNFPNKGFIMADAVLIYALANVLNSGYTCHKLVGKRDLNFFPKVSITTLLLFLGFFVVASLYNKIEVGTLILGYYFVAFGLLNLLEPFSSILIDNKKLQKKLFDFLSYKEENDEKDGKDEKDEKITKRQIKKQEKHPERYEVKPKVKIKNRTIKKIRKK
jgi:uncharacterized membrane protein HdeD (DUF308 family)